MSVQHAQEPLADRKAAQARAGDHRWLVLVIVSVAQLMVVLDATVVNIALPSAQADLHFADGQRQWIVTAYALAFGSLLLLGGRIGDLFGRKRTFIAGLALFAVASAVGGAAPSFGVLVASRAVQGVAGAMLAPAALGTLVTTFRDPRDRGRAFGVFGTVAVAGGAVGLILGGVLTQYLSWRWAMYVNVVFAAVAAGGALFYMNHERAQTRHRIDLLGTLLASAGLFGLVFGFSHAESAGWTSVVTLTSLALSVVLLVSFIVVEARVAEVPLLPLRIVTDASRAMAFAAVAIAGIAMFGVFLFLTYYLQQVRGFSPVSSGLAFLPMIGCVMISSNLSNIVTLPRFGPRIIITIGMVLGALAMVNFTRLDVHSSYVGVVLPSLIVMGLAMGMVMAPAMNTATAGVAPADSGVAAALVSTMQQVGGSVGTAILSTTAATVTTSYAAAHRSLSDLTSIAATHGYVAVFVVSASLFGLGAILGATFFPSKSKLDRMRSEAAGTATDPATDAPADTEPSLVAAHA